MAVNWTPKQQEIICNRNRDLLVAAAAGSGKTAVLIEHIRSLLTDPEHPVDVDHLLVLTFTRAAAEEMRERLARALDDCLEQHPDDKRLQKQQMLLHHAHISTIDSFCMWLVKNYFHRLDLDPDFRLTDEGEEKLLRADVLDTLLEEQYLAVSPEFISFVDAYTNGKGDDSLRELILKLYTFAESAPYPEQWLKDQINLFPEGTVSIEEFPFIHSLMEELRRELQSLSECLRYAKDELAVSEDVNPGYVTTFSLDLDLVEELLQEETFGGFCERLQKLKFSRKPAKKRGQELSENEEACSSLRDFMKNELNRLKKRYDFGSEKQICASILGSQKAMNVLLSLTIEFSSRLAAYKKEKNLANFSDVEHMALTLLEESEEIAASLSKQFEEVIVDEYQDSNLVQEAILRAVSREQRGGHNRFMVGDVKQSIYRFRMARPDLFMEKYHEYGKDGDQSQLISLSRNFRSRKEVLDSVNHVFYQLMGEDFGGISYDEENALYPGADYPLPPEGTNVQTELLLADGEDDSENSREWEARIVADRIRDIVRPGSPIRVWDAAAKEYRPAQYRDIVVLLRTMDGWAQTFVAVFLQEGIPAVAQQKKGYFSAYDVQLICNFLRVIDNPYQDIPLMSVLVSPIGRFTDEEIAQIVSEERARPEEVGGDPSLYRACCHSENSRMQEFLALLELLRSRSSYTPIHELLEQILEETGYGRYLSALPSGETRRANIEMLKEKALAFEQTSYHGIFQFNRYLEQIRKFDVDFGEASLLSEQDNLVRVTSIHKSKGLEFPIVFVSGMGKKFNLQDARKSVVMQEQLGVASDYLDRKYDQKYPTLWKRYVMDRLTRDSKEEELRILYVAMTRAKEKLILTGVEKDPEAKMRKEERMLTFEPSARLPEWYVASANSYLDWLFMSLARDRGNYKIRCLTVRQAVEEETGRQLKYSLIRESLNRMDPEEVQDADCRREWKIWKDFRYSWQEATRTKGTVSVSELKARARKKTHPEEAEEEKGTVPQPQSMAAEPSETDDTSSAASSPAWKPSHYSPESAGALRGTAYHLLLERVPAESGNNREAVKEVLKELVDNGEILPELAATIRPDDITAFYRSPLGLRLLTASHSGRSRREQPFVMGLTAEEAGLSKEITDRILIQGIIDVYFEEEDGLVLLDYKTDYVRPGEEYILAERYHLQLFYYRKALEMATGKMVKEAWLYSFCLRKPIRIFPEIRS